MRVRLPGKSLRLVVCLAMLGAFVPAYAVATEEAPPKVAGEVVLPPGTVGELGDSAKAAAPVAPEGSSSPLRDAVGGDKSRPAAADHATGQVIVRFKSGVSAAAVTTANARIGAKTTARFPMVSGLQLVTLTSGLTVEQAIAKYEALPEVAYAQPNYIVQVTALDPDDSRYAEQWHLKNTGQNGGTADADIDADEAWSFQTGSSATVIGVIDTGLDYTHPDVNDNVWVNSGETPGDGIDNDLNGYVDDVRGWNTYANGNDPYDENGHGTHVAGLLGAEGNNALGVSGVNWNVSIVPIRAFDAYGNATSADLLEAFAYADALGLKIVNASWGYTGMIDQAEYDAMAAMPDTLFVCAAGNEGADNDVTPFYPASYDLPNILSVGATDNTDAAASFSNFGATTVDVFAPGVDDLSTIPGVPDLTREGDTEIYRENFDSLDDWQPSVYNTPGLAWGLSSDYSWSPGTSMMYTGYGNNQGVYMLKSTPLDLSSASNPWMHFRMGYSTEDGWDYTYYGIYDADTDIWYELSPSGAGYSGYRQPWESGDFAADLSPWVGHTDIYPYFGFESDGSVSGQDFSGFFGVWVDDLVVVDDGVVFEDGFDTASSGWTVNGNFPDPFRWNWDGGNGTNGDPAHYGCWKANPYLDNEWASLTSGPLDFTNLDHADLAFSAYWNLETWCDYLHVQVSTDGGSSWTTYASWDGYSGGWVRRTLSLDALVGEPDVRIRFALTSDSSVIYDGAWVDDVLITGAGSWTSGTTYSHAYRTMSGTSMASPVATGVAGLLLSRYPAMTTSQLKAGVMDYAEPVAGLSSKCVTGARVNVMDSFVGLDNAPAAVADTFYCNEDGSINANVLANDADAEGDAICVTQMSSPSNGVLTFPGDGTFTYTPNANWNGSDSFTYKGSDGIADSAVVSVSLTVNAVNDAPVAADDNASCTEDSPVVIAVLANDSDIENDTLTPVKMSDPANGAVVLNADKTFTYTPNPNWFGADSFTYKVNDGGLDSGIATVHIGVANSACATADSYKVQANGMLAIVAPGLLANDSAGDSLWVVRDSGPSHGLLSLNPDGSFIYVPNQGFVGIDTFTYHATDGMIDTSVVTVTLDVRPFGPPVDNAQGVIYRFYNIKTGAHFYTLSLEERNSVLQKYQGIYCYEGPAFWSFAAEGSVPVHRFFNLFTGSHFYTADESERAMVQTLYPYLYKYEGTAFHVFTAPGAGRVPVYRFWNPTTGLHFYTANEAEKANVQANLAKYWKYEGVGFYVLDGSI